MTTAHRPTFNPAHGRAPTALSASVSAKDEHVVPMKLRQVGQDSAEEVAARDFKAELLSKEQEHFEKKRKADTSGFGAAKTSAAAPSAPAALAAPDAKKPKLLEKYGNMDADDSDDDDDDGGKGRGAEEEEDEDENGGEEEDDDDEEDEDTAELLRELEKIKKERADEEAKLKREQEEEQQRMRSEQVLTGNPLLAPQDYSLKKKWYEDVVFKNCAKNETKLTPRFINDTTRSDFHRKFLTKYIK